MLRRSDLIRLLVQIRTFHHNISGASGLLRCYCVDCDDRSAQSETLLCLHKDIIYFHYQRPVFDRYSSLWPEVTTFEKSQREYCSCQTT